MATAREPIDFYFDFLSSYGYFASLRIEELAARHGREVRWHSMLLGVAVMKTMGLKPLLETPLKSDYVLRDTARYMRRHGLQLRRRLTDPFMDPRAAARGFYWVRRNRPGREGAFARAGLHRYWVEGIDLGAPADVAALAPIVMPNPRRCSKGSRVRSRAATCATPWRPRWPAVSSGRPSSSSTASPSGAATASSWSTNG